MAAAVELTGRDYADGIRGGVVLVDFWAPWCGPCWPQGEIVEKVAERVGDRAKVVKVNVDDAQNAAHEFRIRTIPTVIVFKDGEVTRRFVGVTSAHDLVSAIEDAQ